MAKKKKLTEKEAKELQKKAVVEEEEGDTRPDEQVFLEEALIITPIGDITIKPWSYGDYYRIADKIEDIFEILEDKNINIDAFSALGAMSKTFDFSSDITEENKEEKMAEMDLYADTVGQANRDIRRLINRIAPHAMPIISATTGRSQEELEQLPIHMVVAIGVMIYYQNIGILGNALGLFGYGVGYEEPIADE